MSTEKSTQALNILQSCYGENGVWASPHRYRYQCWTRDLALAILPALIRFGGERGAGLARRHLEALSVRIREDGRVPILFADDLWKMLGVKVEEAVDRHKIGFPLRRMIEEGGEEGLYNLTPGTKDSEIMYIVAMLEYANLTGDHTLLIRFYGQIFHAYWYVKEHLLRDGLVVGCDWRDTMEKELGDKTLLTNNSLWYHALSMLAEFSTDLNGVWHNDAEAASLIYGEQFAAEAAALKDLINERFFVNGAYQDRPEVLHIDPLGTSLAVLYGIVPPERYLAVVSALMNVNTSYGVTISCRHNPQTEAEALVIEETNGVVVWPFIVGFTVMALAHMGEFGLARNQFAKLESHSGFYEYYNPANGFAMGSADQLWSAVLYLRAAAAIGELSLEQQAS
ncbi:hypothetical protein H6786_01525 [Candidatus Nomurabacteria bacterium]|nr:hypothetical protein [Candidatus Nomurabacteria bacterium]